MLKVSQLAPIALLSLALLACKDDETTTPVTPLTSTTVKDIPADPTTSTSTGQPQAATGKFTLYSLKDNKIIANSDSATTKWDLGFRATTIIVNGGVSGPGLGGASVASGIFDEIKTVPTTTTFAQDSKTAYAIPTGSGNGWYTYNSTTNIIAPTAGKVILVKTAEGRYAKVEILSYYKDAPAVPTATSVSRYFTLRYLYQPDGTTTLQ